MKSLIVTIGTTFAVAVCGLAPAYAAGGPPTLDDPTPSTVPMDALVTISGSGCDANSPISIYLFDPSGGPDAFFNHTTDGPRMGTGWTADVTGSFSQEVPLEERFSAGSEVGVTASCTPVLDQTPGVMSTSVFLFVTLPDPQVDLIAPTRAGYGSATKVSVMTSDANGSITLSIPGHPDQVAGSSWGPVEFDLPQTLSVGSHALTAAFDPTVEGAPTVTDTATLLVTKATSKTTLNRLGPKKVRAGRTVRLKFSLTSTGPRTGKILIKDGKKVRRSVVLRTADSGTLTLRVTMPTKGIRFLTAVYKGNSLTKASKSPRLRVKVAR